MNMTLIEMPTGDSRGQIHVGRQIERQAAGAALLREDSPRCVCAYEIDFAASRTPEGIQLSDIERADDQRQSGARERPLDDREDQVVVADEIRDDRARD